MKTRLNLTIEASLLDRIKKYAAQKEISVSDLTEAYYVRLLNKKADTASIFDFLEKVKPGNYREDFDFKANYHEKAGKKYGR